MTATATASYEAQLAEVARLRAYADELFEKAQAARPSLGGPMTLSAAIQAADAIRAVLASDAWAEHERLMAQWQEAAAAAGRARRAMPPKPRG
jgi:hypothetical protein